MNMDAHQIAYYAVRGTNRDPVNDVAEVEEMIENYAEAKSGQVETHCYLPEDFEDFLTEVTDNDGWVFINGKWRKYGWKSRTTKELYYLFQRDKNRIGK